MAAEANIGAVVLAAGASRRFGEDNKLLADLNGCAVIVRVIAALARAGVAQIVVVSGWDREGVETALAGQNVRLVHNPDWEAGMGGSIGVGIAALDAKIDAALVVPGDVPLLTAAVVSRLIAAFEEASRSRVVYPTTLTGEQRNPVLWPRGHFAALTALAPAEGAKALLQTLPASACLAVPIADENVFLDVDTQSELTAARRRT